MQPRVTGAPSVPDNGPSQPSISVGNIHTSYNHVRSSADLCLIHSNYYGRSEKREKVSVYFLKSSGSPNHDHDDPSKPLSRSRATIDRYIFIVTITAAVKKTKNQKNQKKSPSPLLRYFNVSYQG